MLELNGIGALQAVLDPLPRNWLIPCKRLCEGYDLPQNCRKCVTLPPQAWNGARVVRKNSWPVKAGGDNFGRDGLGRNSAAPAAGRDYVLRQPINTIEMLDTETGELTEKTLSHEGNEVREFYAGLEGPVVVGIEATGAMQWFLELLEELGIVCRVGHPAKIRAAETRKQKHDRRDARLSWTC